MRENRSRAVGRPSTPHPEPRLRPRTLLVASLFVAACGSTSGDGPAPTESEPFGTQPENPAPPGAPAPAPPALGEEPTGPGGIVADLRADTNRDGAVRFDDPKDNEGEDAWNEAHGAVFLANIDDDTESCTTTGSDVDLPKCNDAADAKVNGPDDAADLARLRTKPWTGAPPEATGSITFTNAERVRLFKVAGETFTVLESGAALTSDDVKNGVELAIEGRDIVRDAAVWDGSTEISFRVEADGNQATDKVVMRVAPLLTYHHLSPAEITWVSTFGAAGNAAMRSDINAALAGAGLPALRGITTSDPWNEDYFETAFMSMPAPGGGQHAIRVNIRSANVFEPESTRSPLRPAGRAVFALRGKDSAAVQEFDPTRNGSADTLNSFGNFETIPPYTHDGKSFPLGRVLRGSVPSFQVDQVFQRMIEAQKVQGPSVNIDTSWLLVAHVDETLSFVKASTPRGWKLLVNDAAMAKTMLEGLSAQGYGSVPMFVGKYWDSRSPAQATVNQVLADTDVMASSAEAVVEIDAQVEILKAATGLTDDEIIRVPFLHMSMRGKSVAYQPGTVNGLYASDKLFIAPKPHGPLVQGKDPFEAALTDALAPLGITVRFAENWDTYHRNLGEVHCGTNATRKVPDVKWWESGK